MKKIAQCLGYNIKKRRAVIGITQEELADKVGVSTETIRNIESGRKWVTVKTVANLSKVLGVTEPELFEDPDKNSWKIINDFGRFLSKVPTDVIESMVEAEDWSRILSALKKAKRPSKKNKNSKR